MCGGFVGDILGAVSNVVESVGNAVGDAVQSVIDNPVGAIVDIGLMAVGVPPVFAGAIGGAAGAAAGGGDILKGALTGGAMGYVGGAAGGAAADAGAGAMLSSAAGGAASGATGALMTGGDIVKGALTGGAMGAGASAANTYFNPATGAQAPVVDMSTWSPDAIAEQNALGNAVSVYDPATGGRTIYNTDATQTVVNPDGGSYTQGNDGSLHIKYADGSVYTKDATGAENWDYSQTGTSTAGTPDTVGNVVGGDQAAVAPGAPGTVAQPTLVPAIVPGAAAPTGTGASTVTSPGFEHLGITQGTGMNAGWAQATPFYNTTNDVQSQFNWGNHNFQAGPGYSAQTSQESAGPVTPWGLQQGPTQLTGSDYAAMAHGTYVPPAPTAPATRIAAYHPVAPLTQQQLAGQVYLNPLANTTAPVAP
jgi:hypothetical protein